MQKPETIENRWDLLYRDYPEVYEAFSQVKRQPLKDLGKMLHVKDKIVVDVAAGTGNSTFMLARYAKKVIGVEPEPAMINMARQKLKTSGLDNVIFKKGTAEHIPLPDSSVEVVTALTSASFYSEDNIKRFVIEAERVTRKNGFIYSLDVAPGWYGGNIAAIIWGPSRRQRVDDPDYLRDEVFTTLGFKHKDFYTFQEFNSLKHIISTYGFIFGKKVIEYIKAYNITTIKWKSRIYSKCLLSKSA
jgi:ubiquinone/menaquinone biosynthesis C-methylase UbiE